MTITLDAFFLADAAQVQGGKLFVLGAAWDRITAIQFPAAHSPMAVAMIFRVNWNDANQEVNFKLNFQDEDGNAVPNSPVVEGAFTVGRPPDMKPGTDILNPIAITLPVTEFRQAGIYCLVLDVNGEEQARRPFAIISRP